MKLLDWITDKDMLEKERESLLAEVIGTIQKMLAQPEPNMEELKS
jgi:hypothetical protein